MNKLSVAEQLQHCVRRLIYTRWDDGMERVLLFRLLPSLLLTQGHQGRLVLPLPRVSTSQHVPQPIVVGFRLAELRCVKFVWQHSCTYHSSMDKYTQVHGLTTLH